MSSITLQSIDSIDLKLEQTEDSTALRAVNSVDPKLEQLENVSNLIRHELRTPLTSIQGVLKLLQHENSNYSAEDADRLIKIAILAADRLTRLADALEGESGILQSMVSMQEMENLQLENDLLDGLKNQEFSLYFQPIFSVEENRIVGFEALARWQHSVKGLVPPDAFIECCHLASASNPRIGLSDSKH